MAFHVFRADEILGAVRRMHMRLEVAARVVEYDSSVERQLHARMILDVVMGMPATALTVTRLEQRFASNPEGSAGLAASMVYVAARALVDEQPEGLSHLAAKLEVNKMEKRLVGLVRDAGLRPWPHSCEFILAPYASARQFAAVQKRYARTNGHLPPVADPDEGLAGL